MTIGRVFELNGSLGISIDVKDYVWIESILMKL